MDVLVVRHRDLRDQPAHLGGEVRHVAADIGVIRALDILAGGPILIAVSRGCSDGRQGGAGQRQVFP